MESGRCGPLVAMGVVVSLITPVRAGESPPQAPPDSAASDSPGFKTGARCRIHTPCPRPPPLPVCAPGTTAPAWSDLVASAPRLIGRTIRVRGPRYGGGYTMTLIGCGANECCNSTNGAVVIGGAPERLKLAGHRCSGDESRRCCDIDVGGAPVVATGRLGPADRPGGEGWALTEVRLCVEQGPGAARSEK